jgi:hypothetical protein
MAEGSILKATTVMQGQVTLPGHCISKDGYNIFHLTGCSTMHLSYSFKRWDLFSLSLNLSQSYDSSETNTLGQMQCCLTFRVGWERLCS